MTDYSKHRTLPFLTVAAALGWDVSKFKTRKAGQEFFGPCYIHQSKSNQTCFSYHVDGKFRCFSCPAKGSGCIDLVRAARNCSFTDAVALLEPLTTQTPSQPQSRPINDSSPIQEASELRPFTGKYHLHKVPCQWLESRVPKEVCDRFGVFCYSNPARKSAYAGRVLVPFQDLDGTLFGYMGRAVEGEPKYLVPTGFPKSRFIFGAHQLKGMHKVVWVVESPFAAMKLASMGVKAVSLYGWSVSDEQLQILQQLTRGVLYVPDRNKYAEAAGQCAKLAQSLWCRMPALPEGVDDPEYLSAEQIAAMR